MIPVIEPYLGEEEKALLIDCIDRNWITGGPKVKEFESKISSMVGVKHAIACMNGTMALYMGLKAMKDLYKWPDGFGVIVPDFTFIASANAVVLAGGNPIFCDVYRDTLNIDCYSAELKLDKTVKAIMPVHIYGQSANLDEVLKFAQDYDLKVIEDAAQGVGVSWKGKAVGSFGDCGIHSYYSDKNLSCSEGGMVLTDNDKIAEKCIRLNNQGRTGRGWYQHDEIGFNFRMTDLSASIGLAQLSKFDFIRKMKWEHDRRYKELLKDIPQVSFVHNSVHSVSVPFRHNILVPEPESLADFLEKNGVKSMRFFYPLHLQKCYNRKGHYPNSIKSYFHGLSLPSSVGLTDGQILYICNKISEFYR